MRRLLLILTIYATLVIPVSMAAAADYYIEYFEITTRTSGGGNPTTYFWFEIRDADNCDFVPVEDVIQSYTIEINGTAISPSPTYKIDEWAYVEVKGTDNNPRDGVIDCAQGELEVNGRIGNEYEIISPVSPHVSGTYTLNVTCINNQVIGTETIVSAGKDASELPPVTNVSAAFEAGLIKVTWSLPTSYDVDDRIDVRLELYEADGSRRYIVHRVKYLPSNSTSYTFLKSESDSIRRFTPFIQIRLRVYSSDGVNMAQAALKDYAVDGYALIPTTITNRPKVVVVPLF